MITPIESTLRQWRAILLLELPVEVVVVFLEVYYHHGDVILTVVVGASLVSYLLGYLAEGHALLPQFENHLGHLFFTVHEIEPI